MSARRGNVTPYLFLAPAALVYVVFLVYPMMRSFAISLTDWDGLSATARFVGASNYVAVFRDETSRIALRNTILWTVVMLLVPSGLGLLLALALDRRVPGRLVFRSVFYLPAVLPLVAVALVWAWLYNPHLGLFNELLRAVGLKRFARGWLSSFDAALPAVLVTAVWQGTGLPMLLYLTGLQGIPRSQHEAAALDGAGPVRRLLHVTLPWLRETHIIVTTLAIIGSVRSFELVYAMTYGGPGRSTQLLGTWMYFNTFQYNHAGLGSAIGWIMAALSMAVTIPYLRLMAKR